MLLKKISWLISSYAPMIIHQHPKHYAQCCINHRCIGGFMHKKPAREVSGPILWRVEEQVSKGTLSPFSGRSGALRNLITLLGPLPPLQNLLEMKRKLKGTYYAPPVNKIKKAFFLFSYCPLWWIFYFRYVLRQPTRAIGRY